MPKDAAGNSAWIVQAGTSTLSRMNLGRNMEQYFNGAARDFGKLLKEMVGVDPRHARHGDVVKVVNRLPDHELDRVRHHLLGYYRNISPAQLQYIEYLPREELVDFIACCIEGEVRNFTPIDSPIETPDMIRGMQANYPPIYGPVTYLGNSGQYVQTKKNIRIGPIYYMLLDKTTFEWAAVSSSPLNRIGIPAQAVRGEKNRTPYRPNPTRGIGETEGRIYAGYAGPVAIAELLDRSSNPNTHRMIVESILAADQPMNIEMAVDRNEIGFGETRPIQMVRHMLLCAGIKTKYIPEA